MNKSKGITLIALVVTIIVLLILAGISVNMLTGQNGILNRALEAKTKTEISGIEEKINIKKMTEEGIIFGKINECLDLNSQYNDKLYIENGQIVYDKNKTSTEEANIFKQMNFKEKTNYYLIVPENKKTTYEQNENVGTISELSKMVNEGTFNYEKVYLLEDIFIEDDSWVPIGTSENKFMSEFEGNNKTIYIKMENESSDGGIFEYNLGKISNLKVDGKIKLKTVGGVAKVNEGTIENCINNAKLYITGGNSGGITGRNDGEIINCVNNGNSTSQGLTIGGIVGWNRGKITNCGNKGFLENIRKTDAANLGGICGSNGGEITKCFNIGNVKAIVNDLGGISGINYSKIENCYNTGNVQGDIYATGGIVGFGVKGQSILKCYNIGKVTGKTATGGIIGSCRIGECVGCKWYTEELEYGIGDAKSNDGAERDDNLTLNDLKELLK